MLYEFAITPDIFDKSSIDDDYANYIIVQQLLDGISDNGLIANLQDSLWIQSVDERVRCLDQRWKNKIITLIKTLKDRKRIVSYPNELEKEPQQDADWLEIALKTYLKEAFHGIILGPNINYSAPTEPFIIHFREALESLLWRERRRTVYIFQNSSDYKAKLAPIMKHAKSLNIIDPYMFEDDRYTNALKVYIDLLCKKNVRIRIHCGIRDSNVRPSDPILNQKLNNWEQFIKSILNPSMGHRIEILIWKKKRNGQRFHDRAIITDQCAVGIEGGLENYRLGVPNKTTLSLLDEEVKESRLRDLDKANSVYQLLRERIINNEV